VYVGFLESLLIHGNSEAMHAWLKGFWHI
jgi:hypothetical protein